MYSSMKTVGALKRAKHNRSCVARGSIMPGIWYPFRYWRTSANESMSIDFSVVWKTLAAVAPVMGRYKLRVGLYYCPRRLYHRDPARNARKFDVRNLKPWLFDDFPNVSSLSGDSYVEPGSFLDWLGLPSYSYGFPASDSTSYDNAKPDSFNIEPLLCYLDIWRNYLSSSTWDKIPMMIFRTQTDPQIPLQSAIRYQDLSLDSLDSLFEQILDYSSSSMPDHATDLIRGFFNNVVGSSSVASYKDSLWSLLRHSGSCFLPARISSDRISRLAGSELSPDVNVQVEIGPGSSPGSSLGRFSITSAALAADLKRYYDTTIASGSRYSEWLNGHYDVQIRDIDRPLELDMFTFDVTFSDVVSVAESSDPKSQQQTLGGMASLSRGSANNGRKSRRYFSPEDGYLMMMVALVPEVSYLEGVQPELLQTSATDAFIPEFNGLGMQTFDPRIAFAGQFNQKKLKSTGFDFAFGGINVDAEDPDTPLTPESLGFDPKAIYGYEPPYMDYTSSLDTLHGDFAGDLSYWALTRSFIGGQSDATLSSVGQRLSQVKFLGLAPYAIPWQYLSQFTDTLPTSTPFQIQMGISYISRSLVSKHQSLTL